jgi:hypothetical protein
MKNSSILSPLFILILSALLVPSDADALMSSKHTIVFGGATGNLYNPSQLTVEVGDTLVWQGDFSTWNMYDSTNIPGVLPVGPVTSGTSFTYIIPASGLYVFADPSWPKMKVSINAIFKPHGSLTNEGREFYLGMIYPTYNNCVPSSLVSDFGVYALVTTFYADTFYVSFYDASGLELSPKRYVLGANQYAQIDLTPSLTSMRADATPETPVYRACHIVSKYPVSVQYMSRGPNATGSYMALPALALGKNYVVASYSDNGNPPTGAVTTGNGMPSTSTIDIASGSFMVIATQDVTSVTIQLASGTSTGRTKGQTFNIGLSKGQCYYVRSDGKDATHDISGTVIQSTKPIVVLSGHEDGFLGDQCVSNGENDEGRNFMIEQLLPVEYWDSTGYIGIPFVEGSSGTCTNGTGDTYRAVTFDNASVAVHADVSGVPGGYGLSTSQLNYGEHQNVLAPVDIYSTNGHAISVIQYDQHYLPGKAPKPAPAMMTLVPHSRWRKSYNFAEFNPPGLATTNPNQYVNILSDSLTQIAISVSGAPEGPLSSGLTSLRGFNTQISSQYTSTRGSQYLVSRTGQSYYLHSDYPFICYMYGMTEFTYGTGFGHGFLTNNFETEYATPAGVELNTGIPPSFKVSYSDLPNCEGWSVSVTDTGNINPGVKAIFLVDDSNGVYYDRPGVKLKNVSFDPTSPDYTTISPKFTNGELHPTVTSNQPYTFTILRNNKLGEAKAPIGIIDNNGNGLLVQLHKDAPTVSLVTSGTPNPDSLYFPTQTVGNQICSTIVVTNTSPSGGSPMLFTGVKFANSDQTFSVSSTPSLPAVIPAQGTLTLSLCSKLTDTKHHVDSLVISNDCFSIKVSLDARGAAGIINAADIAFGNVDTGKSVTKTIIIHNSGTADFKLLPSSSLADNVNFTIDPAFLATLPITVKAGLNSPTINVTFHPKQVGSDSTNITWNTDIDPSFAGVGRSFSVLTGNGLAVSIGAVGDGPASQNSFAVRPNPARGNTAIVSFSIPSKEKASIAIFDVLGRELYTRSYSSNSGEFEIPIGYLTQGMYYVRLTSEDVVLTQKLEVQR